MSKMVASREKIRTELKELISLGQKLYARLLLVSNEADFDEPPLRRDDDESQEEYDQYLVKNLKAKKLHKKLTDIAKGTPSFSNSYEEFYTLASKCVKALAPHRLDDFIKQYKEDKRKEVSVANYLISDAIVGYESTYGHYDRTSALPRLLTQTNILSAILKNFDKSLNDIETLIQADLFDSELESAKHLLSRGHIRAAGAVAGVVLEAHLSTIAHKHGFKSRKKNPTISDFNEFLKSEAVLEIPEWRKIQSLGDIRNLCDHPKSSAPKNGDVEDMIRGVARVIKEIV